MSNTVIKVENLSKQYRLGAVGTGSMRDDFKKFRYKMMGKENPFLTVGEENDRTTISKTDYVWALRNLNFEVQQGDVVGIIGRNGAGKSTLLKILSRTTGPTVGTVKMKGRIASLLEVGTGFHGELSGRDNIYLNGAIMGLRKHEIKKKLDEIIDFAGVERYIDTPVKRYSSGMYVRLAFGVAAHLEPDIMIVDEVLAVGDAEFQKKALGKMKEVSNREGRTVLFVSHNMAAIKNLCPNSIFLSNGKLEFIGNTSLALMRYLEYQEKTLKRLTSEQQITKTQIISTAIDLDYKMFENYTEINLTAKVTFQNVLYLQNCYINFVVEDFDQQIIIHHRTDRSQNSNPNFEIGTHQAEIILSKVYLKPGIYNYWFRIFCREKFDDIILDSEKTSFEITGEVFGGVIHGPSSWRIN